MRRTSSGRKEDTRRWGCLVSQGRHPGPLRGWIQFSKSSTPPCPEAGGAFPNGAFPLLNEAVPLCGGAIPLGRGASYLWRGTVPLGRGSFHSWRGNHPSLRRDVPLRRGIVRLREASFPSEGPSIPFEGEPLLSRGGTSLSASYGSRSFVRTSRRTASRSVGGLNIESAHSSRGGRERKTVCW